MVKDHNIFAVIHIHFKKNVTSDEIKNRIYEDLKKYVNEKSKKPNIGKMNETKSGMQVTSSDASITLGFQKDNAHVVIDSFDSSKILLDVDKTLNKILILLDSSEQKIGQVMSTLSKTIPIKKDPLMKLINRESLAEFSSQMKKSFKPRAIHLTAGIEEISGKEQEFSLMFSHDEDELELELTIETRSSGVIPLDLLVKSNKTINAYKKKVFTIGNEWKNLKGILDLVTLPESDSDNLHQLESWKYRQRLRRAQKKFLLALAQKSLREEVVHLYDMIEQLQKQSKQKQVVGRNEGDDVYDMHKKMLEKEHMNKIVAIDIENKEIVGYGNTPEEAFFDAKMSKPEKDQFYFRKVGSPYVEIL